MLKPHSWIIQDLWITDKNFSIVSIPTSILTINTNFRIAQDRNLIGLDLNQSSMIGSEAQLDEWVLARPSSGTVHGGINVTDSQQYGAHNEVSVFSCESGIALHCTVRRLYFETLERRFMFSLTFWKLSLDFNLKYLSHFFINFNN